MAVLELENLVKIYSEKTKALANVSFSVEKGEIFGLLGPNGAGKTSLIKILIGFSRQTSGDFRIFSEKASWQNRKKIGYLPEKISIHPFLTAVEFLKVSAALIGLEKKLIKQRIPVVLERVKLSHTGSKKIGAFSKGMMQRLGLAAAIIGEPEILLLDEPGSGLDPIGTVELREIILEEKKRGAAILVNSHRLSEIEKICDRVGIINYGKMIASGSLHELQTGNKRINFTIAEKENAVIEKVKNSISGFAKSVTNNENQFTLVYDDESGMKTIPGKIVEAGAELLKYEKLGESLEDIFMRVMKSNE